MDVWFRFAFVWIKGRLIFIIIKGNAWPHRHWPPLFYCFRPLGGSFEWGLAAEVGQREPTIFKGKKMFWTETSSHSQPEHKNCFGIKILGTRALSWAWGATSVPCPLGSTLVLGSCKRCERNRPIPTILYFLNFPNKSHKLGPYLKE